MLKEAIAAGLPIITCTTLDTYNVRRVVQYLTGKPPAILNSFKEYTGAGPKSHWITFHGLDANWDQVREKFSKNAQTLIVVNPEHKINHAFDAGVVPVPPALVSKVLTFEFGMDKADAKDCRMALGGLTLREVQDVCCLAQNRHQELSARAIRDVRLTATHVVPGVAAVSTELPFYWEHAALYMWVQSIGVFLLKPNLDHRLRPRGLLMDGKPGTGKTLGAKWVAAQLGVPLFRLDLGALMSKYVGESEANLNRALNTISSSEPCVMLIDEVEKLFIGTDDSGVTANLLAGLLWWLQEHRNRVLTIMTTNAYEKLPAELVRPGRIDDKLVFENLDKDLYAEFEENLIGSLGLDSEYPFLSEAELTVMDEHMSFAAMTSHVLNRVRGFLLDKPDT